MLFLFILLPVKQVVGSKLSIANDFRRFTGGNLEASKAEHLYNEVNWQGWGSTEMLGAFESTYDRNEDERA